MWKLVLDGFPPVRHWLRVAHHIADGIEVHSVAGGRHFGPLRLKVIEFDKDGTAEVWSDFLFEARCDICKISTVSWLRRASLAGPHA